MMSMTMTNTDPVATAPGSDLAAECRKIAALLNTFKFTFENEKELQGGIESVLTSARFVFKREVPLGGRQNIIDFLIEPTIGLEVKIQSGLSSVTRQLYRYAESDKITHLILVTSCMRHTQIPAEMVSKPLTVIHLIGSVF